MRTCFQDVAEGCIECGLCREECPFLQRYGLPKWIAETCGRAHEAQSDFAFECSLCGLCTAVCPVRLDPMRMFLQMRREAFEHGAGEHPEHRVLLNYERRGVSSRYSHRVVPPGCHTVFFPGCTLAGTRPARVLEILEHMRRSLPSVGVVLDCCAKPSHDLGRADQFQSLFGQLKSQLLAHGVQRVVVACPSCYSVFKEHGEEISVTTVYELMLEHGLPRRGVIEGCVTVHDPCAVRFEGKIHDSVRELLRQMGLTVDEMAHHREKALCCGEGGAVGFLKPDFSNHWKTIRKQEVNGHGVITYCAGCVNTLRSVIPISHLLDLVFDAEATLAGRARVSRAPLTYWNRLRLKRRLKKGMACAVTGDRGSLLKG